MKKPDIHTYNEFLEKTFKFILIEKDKTEPFPIPLDPFIIESFTKLHEKTKELYQNGDIAGLKRMFNSTIADMLDDPYYLDYIKDYQDYFPKLLHGTQKVIKRILKQKKITNRIDYDIINSVISFVKNPVLEDFNAIEIKMLHEYCFNYETLNR